mmetsp:Transcript_59751/g.105966  ORF Transcript_59751/g.105966 Transcript_59751/m.105966 type:complete len:253 (-) Transcript_59751:141-899(-)
MAGPAPTGPCSVLCVLLAVASVSFRWYSSERKAPAAAPVEPYGGNSIGQILAVLIILWLAFVIAGAVLKGRATANSIAEDAVKSALGLSHLLFWGALITPVYSTVFVFNGPKYVHMVPFSYIFEMHAGVYKMATQQLLTITTMALPCLILWVGTRITTKYISWFIMICPSQKLNSWASNMIQVLPQAMDLVLAIPLLLLFCGWVCWLTMLLTGRIRGEKTVFRLMLHLLLWIEGHTHNLSSRIAFSVFGKWR